MNPDASVPGDPFKILTPAAPDASPEPTIDPTLKALLEAAIKAAVAEALEAAEVPTLRPAVVQGVSPDSREVSVIVDGDTAATTAQCLIDLPPINGRVMVTFGGKGTVFVAGRIDGDSCPAGCLMAYVGRIDADVVSSATTVLPPPGWLWCYGQAVDRADFPALFAAISTTFNTGGEAATQFRLPDLRAHIPIGMDNMGGTDRGVLGTANVLGQTLGVDLAVANDVGYTVHYIVKC